MTRNEVNLSDIIVGAGIVTFSYYLMSTEPLGVFCGIVTASVLYALYRAKSR